jgi:hypothetical protein
MSYSSFVFESRDGVATIRLNDPEKLTRSPSEPTAN